MGGILQWDRRYFLKAVAHALDERPRGGLFKEDIGCDSDYDSDGANFSAEDDAAMADVTSYGSETLDSYCSLGP